MKLRSIFAIALWAAGSVAAQAESLKVAVTTSFHNSGLSEVLLPEIKKDTGIEVQLLVVGTGQALRLGEAGDVDAILVHSKAAEEKFVLDGYGVHRREIMFNDFVLVGPSQDPAAIAEAGSAADALARIAEGAFPFVSRGDDSGTHKKELSLWTEAGITGEERAVDWYKEAGAGMGASLNTASGLNAYIMSDRASWLKFGNKGDLEMLFAGDPALFNQYAYLPVNPEKHPHVKAKTAMKLEDWLVSDRARDLIDGYVLEGGRLFVFNAKR
ncbi:substrate-binding domain-containing protein [Shimia sp. MMG029]|uniref:substrate-binding domain-containing protein n=1 Tax=Shimia sp. MMG029 TaxID=3021978 RepID=UPI0022FE40F4|nr:substrate-binding domain-containing protein [Shimia sp. MMG029]MDA5557496.1 substrate-binding domain-containing protein [Shimia sp. MMG029]